MVSDPDNEDDPAAAPAAPKQPKKKRKDIQYEIKKDQLAVLIKTTFEIWGSREGQEIWKLSQKESELLAEPLSALMAKNPIIDRLTSEYGDWIALIVALGTIILPRLFIALAARPKKKESVKPYVTNKKINEKQGNNHQPATTSGNESGANGNSLEQSSRQLADTRGNFGAQLYGIIPAIQ